MAAHCATWEAYIGSGRTPTRITKVLKCEVLLNTSKLRFVANRKVLKRNQQEVPIMSWKLVEWKDTRNFWILLRIYLWRVPQIQCIKLSKLWQKKLLTFLWVYFIQLRISIRLPLVSKGPRNFPGKFDHSSTEVISKLTSSKFFRCILLQLCFKMFAQTLTQKKTLTGPQFTCFALLSMYETREHADFCGILLEKFCKSMSRKYPMKPFESINFHLLRRLSWQCNNFEPLWVTSATSFESANHHLIRPVTGSVNICRLLATRYIRNKELQRSKIRDDVLKSFVENLSPEKKHEWQSYNLQENSFVNRIRAEFPRSLIFCRYRFQSFFPFFLDSLSYRRSDANSYVLLRNENPQPVQILLFFEDRDEVKVLARFFSVEEKIDLNLGGTELEDQSGLLKPLGYVCKATSENRVLSIKLLKSKLIRFGFRDTVYLINILDHFEHDWCSVPNVDLAELNFTCLEICSEMSSKSFIVKICRVWSRVHF